MDIDAIIHTTSAVDINKILGNLKAISEYSVHPTWALYESMKQKRYYLASAPADHWESYNAWTLLTQVKLLESGSLVLIASDNRKITQVNTHHPLFHSVAIFYHENTVYIFDSEFDINTKRGKRMKDISGITSAMKLLEHWRRTEKRKITSIEITGVKDRKMECLRLSVEWLDMMARGQTNIDLWHWYELRK